MISNTQERFLVTGATGFIGSCLVRELVKQKNKVSVLVRNKELNWRLKDIASLLDVHECDLLSPGLSQVIDNIKPSVIFHLATYGALPLESNVDQMIDVNIKGTRNLIEAVKKNTFKLFVNTGSSSEYGIKDKKMKEDDVASPINDYGVTKVASTLFCQKIAITESLPIITFRLFSPYGYYEEKNRLIPTFVYKSLQDKVINLSLPFHVRDFIFIEDVVAAYIHVIDKPIVPGDIYNIASGKQNTIQQIADLILKITGSKSLLRWNEKKSQSRQIEPKIWEADIEKAYNVLQWRPQYDLESGLKKTFLWFRENKEFYE